MKRDDRKGDNMWFLCQESYKTFDDARKRAMEIGRKNFDSIHKECYGLFFKRTVYVVLWWKWIEKGDAEQMERLTERYDITPDGESDVWVKQHDYISAMRKLCDYEDLEEQGLLVRLPCKVGTEVFVIFPGINHYAKCQIKKIEI